MRRPPPHALSLSIALLATGHVGCLLDWDPPDDGGTTTTAASGTTTGSASSGVPFDVVCMNQDCDTRCPAGSACKVNCGTSDCSTYCGDAASCDVMCGTGDCSVYCEQAGACNVQCFIGDCSTHCEANPCRLDCNPGADGTLYCNGGSCTLASMLSQCTCLGDGC